MRYAAEMYSCGHTGPERQEAALEVMRAGIQKIQQLPVDVATRAVPRHKHIYEKF